MRASTTLQRSLARLTVDSHRQIRSRDNQTMFYGLAEREHQFQFPITGTVGMVPVETTIKVLFDIVFLYEYGYRRDSQLLEPHSRFGFTSLSAPAGTVPYAHVADWIQDEDLNYIGAHVICGVHNPGIAVTGVEQLSSTTFSCTLHCSFQGFGFPIDPDGPSGAGAASGAPDVFTGINPGG
jgi:hypothetical protein